MKMEEATAYTDKCFNAEPASCSYACPFHLDIRSFMDKAMKGRWAAAYKMLRNTVVFPSVAAALCDQPCRNHCQRTQIGDEAVAMRDIEAACIKYAKNRAAENYIIPPKSQRVAVIGAGVAGLSCALNLAQKKYQVTVYDSQSGWGGSLRTHPRFDEFDADFSLQFGAVSAEFRYDAEIKALEELSGFDAVFIATGEGGESFGLLSSWQPGLFTTSAPKVFMGGGLCGSDLMESIAQGIDASKMIETFLQTGRTPETYLPYSKKNCERYLKHEGEPKKPMVAAASPGGYSEEEAKAEASRCFKCDCNYCEASCEMLKYYRKKPQKLGMEVFTDSLGNSLVSPKTLTRETYSCNICGKCKSVCPESVDIGALLQFSRADRLNSGKDVPAYHDYWLREMDFHTGEGSFSAAPKGKKTCEYAFFPGCQLGAFKPEHVIKSYEYLNGNVDAGLVLSCCGAPAYWAGDERRLRGNVERLRKSWEDLGKPIFVFACASCVNMFEKFMPEIKGVSLYELLSADESILPAQAFKEASVFDPCAAREKADMQESVRNLAKKAGIQLEELKEQNRCCGYGGHIQLANPGLYEEITINRAGAGVKPYIVYCANCRDVFDHRNKECVHILDMVFATDGKTSIPSLHQKKLNSLEVKTTLMNNHWDMDFAPETHEWDSLNLIISDELLEQLDRKLITEDDLRESIWLAETTGEKFIDEQDGMTQCSMEKSVLTYWVQYKKTAPDAYEIYNAFSHRMHINKEG
jgi:Fe-S oxidoreductase